jgi:Xaa-Pro aminopeptidase
MADVTDPAELSHARVELVRDVLRRRGASGALLSARRNIAWVTGGSEAHIVLSSETAVATLVITADAVRCVTQNIEAARLADEELAGLGIELVSVPWWEPGSVAREADRIAGTAALDDAALEPALVPLRSVLAPLDHERMATIGAAGRDAVNDALAAIEPGQTEADLVGGLLGRLGGLRAPVVLVAADDRLARYRHPLPKDRPIRRRVMLVIVAERWGLHVALTRIRELEPPDTDLRRRIEATRDVELAMHEATVPGATLGDVLVAAQRAYAAAGVPDEWRDHHQGGTIAFQGRETVATPGDPTRIEPAMAFAWNPSIAGAKAEDTFVLATDGGRRVVTADAPGSD